jgi:hypothetical protein
VLDISLAGLIGAIVGTLVAGVSYHLTVGVLDRWMHERVRTADVEERDRSEDMLSLARRMVLIVDWLLFAGLGYWLGDKFWG